MTKRYTNPRLLYLLYNTGSFPLQPLKKDVY